MIRYLGCQSGRGRRFDPFRVQDVYAWTMSASRQEVSCGVRVELRKSLESVLGHLDGSALMVLVEDGRALPALGVRALRARVYRVENPLIASETTYLPLRMYIYEENGATVLLTYDQPSSALPKEEEKSGLVSAQQQNISP
jgi:hypothetical protein